MVLKNTAGFKLPKPKKQGPLSLAVCASDCLQSYPVYIKLSFELSPWESP